MKIYLFATLLFINAIQVFSKDIIYIQNKKQAKCLLDYGHKNVFIYFDYSCPICMAYRQKIAEILVRTGDSINVNIVFTPMTDTTEIFTYSDFKNSSAKFIYDTNFILSKRLKVNVVPTVIIFINNKKVYVGKFDDRYSSIVDDKMNIIQDYVEDVLFLNKKHDDNEALGCKFR